MVVDLLPIVLLIEIHKPKIFKSNFFLAFLQIMVEFGEKYDLKTFKFSSRPFLLSYDLVENVTVKLQFFMIFICIIVKMQLSVLLITGSKISNKKTQKLKSAVVDPPLCYPLVSCKNLNE